MDQLSTAELKLGKIGYLNVLPLYYPLESGVIPHPFRIISGAPAHLNQLMAAGELDLSVVSSIEYARHHERYYILPDLSISCCGAVKSVLLFSRVPIGEIDGSEVLVSTQSHTSIALLKILCAFHLRLRVAFKPANCTEVLAHGKPPRAFLAIGDEALRLQRCSLYPHRLDLGEAWHAWTGLPFVFALWVIQRQTVERWNGSLQAAIEMLWAAKHWGAAHSRIICGEAVRKGLLSSSELEEYYLGLNFDLNSRQQEGLRLFYSYLAKAGEISSAPQLEIYSPFAGAAPSIDFPAGGWLTPHPAGLQVT